MKKHSYLVLLTVGLQFILGCGSVSVTGEAEGFAESFLMERIENGGLGSDTFYSESFWHSVDRGRWERLKNIIHGTLGDLESYSLNSSNVESPAKLNELYGTFVVLRYDTVYAKGSGTETLTLYKPITGGKFSIVKHNFNSPEIQRLIGQGIIH